MRSSTRQRGFTLLEVLVVTVILAATLAVFLRSAAPRAERQSNVTAFASEFVAYADRVRGLTTGMDYTGLTVRSAVEVMPPEWIVDIRDSVQRHPLGSTLTVSKIAVGAAADGGLQLVAAGVDPAACSEVVSQTAPRAHRVLVGATVLKASGGAPVNPVATRAACVAANPATITWQLLL